MTWYWGEGGRCCDLVPGEGGVVTWSWGRGGRCCDLVLGGGEGDVVTWSWGGGREVLSPDPRGGGKGGVMTFGVTHLPPYPLNRMSDTRL